MHRYSTKADTTLREIKILLPTLTVNGQFMEEFMSARTPCFALGMVELGKRQCGLLALRPDKVIPAEIADAGIRFGHSLLGDANFEVVHFAFQFYGFETYNVLVNPSNPLVQTVLTTMVQRGEYFFFAVDSKGKGTAFRSEIGQENLAGIKTNLLRIQNSRTTDTQYRKAVSFFEKTPEPTGTLLNWVCGENAEYLDLTEDRLELTPAKTMTRH